MKICEDPWECIELVPSSAHSRDQDTTYKLEDVLYEGNMQMHAPETFSRCLSDAVQAG